MCDFLQNYGVTMSHLEVWSFLSAGLCSNRHVRPWRVLNILWWKRLYMKMKSAVKKLTLNRQRAPSPRIASAPQLLAVRPPQHQHGRVCSQNTPSVCSQLSQWGQSCQVTPLFGTLVSVRLSPEFGFFFFSPTYGMLPPLIHKESHPDPKVRSSLLWDFKLHLFCIHTLDQLSSAVLPPPPPPLLHSPPKHRAESRPQAYQFLCQSSHNSSRATEQERLKERLSGA